VPAAATAAAAGEQAVYAEPSRSTASIRDVAGNSPRESSPVESGPPQPPSDLSSLDGEERGEERDDDGGGQRAGPTRLMSMDSGIQGSSYSCDQEEWPNEGADAALREAMDTLDR